MTARIYNFKKEKELIMLKRKLEKTSAGRVLLAEMEKSLVLRKKQQDSIRKEILDDSYVYSGGLRRVKVGVIWKRKFTETNVIPLENVLVVRKKTFSKMNTLPGKTEVLPFIRP